MLVKLTPCLFQRKVKMFTVTKWSRFQNEWANLFKNVFKDYDDNNQGTLTERGRLRAVDHLINIFCCVKKKLQLYYEKWLIWTSYFKEFNGTDPSPSVSIPCNDFKHFQDVYFSWDSPDEAKKWFDSISVFVRNLEMVILNEFLFNFKRIYKKIEAMSHYRNLVLGWRFWLAESRSTK